MWPVARLGLGLGTRTHNIIIIHYSQSAFSGAQSAISNQQISRSANQKQKSASIKHAAQPAS
eukprot:scaffold4890_cov136-Isochrysis_galbana.AAC.2